MSIKKKGCGLTICFYLLVQEGTKLLTGKGLDVDAHTRGQQKKIDEIHAEKPAAKKARLSKETTMIETTKVCKNAIKKNVLL